MQKKNLLLVLGILTLVFALLSFKSFGQAKDKRIGLTGYWKFHLGDNAKFSNPGHDDTSWDEIYVPSDWYREGYRDYRGYAWYRRTVEFDFTSSDALYIELGRIDDVDEVYVNGHLIGTTGGFPPNYYTAYNYHRRYAIPLEHLQKGKNVIAVRVFDEGGEGGIMGRYSSSIGIYNYPNYSTNSFSLFGSWKFHKGDKEEWSAQTIDETDWSELMVPANWESQGHRRYDGFAWYRKTFKLPANFNTKDLLLLLGKIDDMDEVFVNGKLVGHTGKIDRMWANNDEYQQLRVYSIDEKILQPGKDNTIAVRVYDQTGDGGIYEGPVSIIQENEYRDFMRDYRHDSGDFFGWMSRYFRD